MKNTLVVELEVVGEAIKKTLSEMDHLFKDSESYKNTRPVLQMALLTLRGELIEPSFSVQVETSKAIVMTLEEAMSGKLEEVLGIAKTEDETA